MHRIKSATETGGYTQGMGIVKVVLAFAIGGAIGYYIGYDHGYEHALYIVQIS